MTKTYNDIEAVTRLLEEVGIRSINTKIPDYVKQCPVLYVHRCRLHVYVRLY